MGKNRLLCIIKILRYFKYLKIDINHHWILIKDARIRGSYHFMFIYRDKRNIVHSMIFQHKLVKVHIQFWFALKNLTSIYIMFCIILDVHKFYRSYTGLNKGISVHFCFLKEIAEEEFPTMLYASKPNQIFAYYTVYTYIEIYIWICQKPRDTSEKFI